MAVGMLPFDGSRKWATESGRDYAQSQPYAGTRLGSSRVPWFGPSVRLAYLADHSPPSAPLGAPPTLQVPRDPLSSPIFQSAHAQ